MTQMDSESAIGSSSTNASTNATANNTGLDIQSPSLIQQYNWYYDKSELKRTPSVVMDNISPEKERIYRNEGARFILNVGSQMKLRYDTLATGVVYFHRFYMRHSFKVFPNYLTAACCLFLAGKAEETPKKCKDIIKFARQWLNDQQFAAFGEDPREEVLTLERIVLQTIRFDLQVDHPYKYILSMAKKLHSKVINDKDKKDLIQDVIQMAWTFTNDSLCTTICLQYEPEIVAIAMIFLASKIRHEINDWEGRLPHQRYWWELFAEDLSLDILEDICHQVLDLYSKPNEQTSGSPPSALPPSNNSPAGRMSEPTTPIKFPLSSSSLVNNPVQPMQPFRPISGLIQSSTNSTTSNIQPQASGPNSTMTTIPQPSALPPSLHAPPMQQHQWDPNLTSFYSKYPGFSLVGLGKNPLAPVHMVVPPPPPPPPGIVPPSMVALDARLPVVGQPPPPVAFPPFGAGVNN